MCFYQNVQCAIVKKFQFLKKQEAQGLLHMVDNIPLIDPLLIQL